MKVHVAIVLCVVILLVPALGTSSVAATDEDKPLLYLRVHEWSGGFAVFNGGFREFGRMAKQAGYRVDQGSPPEITAELLATVDTFVYNGTHTPLTDAEKIALRQFVRNGGKLIIWGWWWSDAGCLNSLIGDYGCHFSHFTAENRDLTLEKDSVFSGPRECTNIKSIGRYEIVVDDPDAIDVLVQDKFGAPFIVRGTKNVGKGKLLIMGSIDVFYAKSGYNEELGGYIHEPYIYLADNRNFVFNFARYCISNYDLRVANIRTKNTAIAGQKHAITATINNLAYQLSDKVDVKVYLVDSADAETDDALLLKLISLPALQGQATYKKKITFNIPSSVSPGTYYLMVRLDEATIPRDDNANNNSFVSTAIVIK